MKVSMSLKLKSPLLRVLQQALNNVFSVWVECFAPPQERKSSLIYTVYATSLEQERLLKEASTLTEISSITWMRGFRQDYG